MNDETAHVSSGGSAIMQPSAPYHLKRVFTFKTHDQASTFAHLFGQAGRVLQKGMDVVLESEFTFSMWRQVSIIAEAVRDGVDVIMRANADKNQKPVTTAANTIPDDPGKGGVA